MKKTTKCMGMIALLGGVVIASLAFSNLNKTKKKKSSDKKENNDGQESLFV
jgi:hypothetical protein